MASVLNLPLEVLIVFRIMSQNQPQKSRISWKRTSRICRKWEVKKFRVTVIWVSTSMVPGFEETFTGERHEGKNLVEATTLLWSFWHQNNLFQLSPLCGLMGKRIRSVTGMDMNQVKQFMCFAVYHFQGYIIMLQCEFPLCFVLMEHVQVCRFYQTLQPRSHGHCVFGPPPACLGIARNCV